MKNILDQLGLDAVNPGTYSAISGWSEDTSGGVLESESPASGEVIASVRSATDADYERVITEARTVFEQWRSIPAPRRGEAVRLAGDALRKYKDPLGSLVSLEMGKIKAEG
ncbi:MAG: aldehyde dehydrogenase family protein, partial [Gammaproteobacteria bacterium]|nr:aldehyde dehydrogenase family protein [Gammaproteobacteria bacterium]